MTIHPLASHPQSQHPKPRMAIRSSSVFSHLRPRVFHISFQTHKAQHTESRGWKKRRTNNHGLGFAPSARREKFMTLLRSFLCICELSRVCIRAKFPQSHQERCLISLHWLIRPLGAQVQAVAFLNTLASLDLCWLLSPADCLLLFCSGTLPSFVFFRLVGDLARKAFVWVSRQNKQRNLTGTHPTHTHKNECPTSWHNVQNQDISWKFNSFPPQKITFYRMSYYVELFITIIHTN